MIRTQIQLPEWQFEALQRLAANQKISMAEIIRRSLEQTLKTTPRNLSAKDKQQNALAVIGKYRSGKRNVAHKHDDYLAEAYL